MDFNLILEKSLLIKKIVFLHKNNYFFGFWAKKLILGGIWAKKPHFGGFSAKHTGLSKPPMTELCIQYGS